MDNLEGGVDYLRAVILEDSLGIGEELEQEMARVVESYQCEWQTTLNDPQRLALFRSYTYRRWKLSGKTGKRAAQAGARWKPFIPCRMLRMCLSILKVWLMGRYLSSMTI